MVMKHVMLSQLFHFWKSVRRRIIWHHSHSSRVYFLCLTPLEIKCSPLTFMLIFIFWIRVRRGIYWYMFLTRFTLQIWPLCKLWPWISRIAQRVPSWHSSGLEEHPLSTTILSKKSVNIPYHTFSRGSFRLLGAFILDSVYSFYIEFNGRSCSTPAKESIPPNN